MWTVRRSAASGLLAAASQAFLPSSVLPPHVRAGTSACAGSWQLGSRRCFAASAKPNAAEVEKEKEKSLALLKSQAEAGNLAAALSLGKAYMLGHHGLTVDVPQSLLWIKR